MSKKILYGVLNWGLGHASRSIPIIQFLVSKGFEIIIASDGEALKLLKKEFPNLYFEKIEPYNVFYSKTKKYFDFTIFTQLNKFSKTIKKEHSQTQKLIEKHNISYIISDNRYGVYSKKIPSTIICHQINLQHKYSFIQKQMNIIHSKMLDKFHEIWVLDFKENPICGNISNKYFSEKRIQKKIKYLGLVSRMIKQKLKIEYKFCIVLSGPEPQRTLFENILINQTKTINDKIAFVRGTNIYKQKIKSSKNIEVFDLLESKSLNEIINKSETVICRAGYSSIMDILKLEKQAILVPTPGQTEQEYLADYLKNKKWFYTTSQEKFRLNKDVFKLKDYKIPDILDKNNYKKLVLNFLKNF